MKQNLLRLHEVIDYLKDTGKIHKQQDIADALGIAKSNLSMALKGNERYLTDGFLKRFAEAYSDYINKDYLVEGVGQLEKIDASALRPHIPLKVAAGFTGVSVGSVPANECEFCAIFPGIPAYDFTICVDGDSMEPEMHSGDTLACAWLDKPKFKPDRYYVIDTTEGAVVKSVTRRGNDLLCTSLNPDFPPFSQPLDTVLRIAEVKAIIRTFK